MRVTRRALPPRVLAAALLAAWLVALPARAALFDDEEARKRIEQTNQRLAQVQKQLDDRIAALEAQLKSQGLVELFSQVEQLKSDVARLRGQIEVLNHEQEQAQKRQRDLYVDLDSRLRRLEGGAGGSVPRAGSACSHRRGPARAHRRGVASGPVGGGTANPPAAAAPDANEQRAYDAALDQFKGGNYAAVDRKLHVVREGLSEESRSRRPRSTGSATRSSRRRTTARRSPRSDS